MIISYCVVVEFVVVQGGVLVGMLSKDISCENSFLASENSVRIETARSYHVGLLYTTPLYLSRSIANQEVARLWLTGPTPTYTPYTI